MSGVIDAGHSDCDVVVDEIFNKQEYQVDDIMSECEDEQDGSCQPYAVKSARDKHKTRCLNATIDSFPVLKNILPPNYNYIVCEFHPLSSYDNEERFRTLFRVSHNLNAAAGQVGSNSTTATENSAAICTASEAESWLHEFESLSKTTWRVDKTYPDLRRKLIFKKDFHCQHNTRPISHKDRLVKAAHKKNTNCPAKLTVAIKKLNKTRRTDDSHAGTSHTMAVTLRQAHNHLIMAADSLRYRPVASSTVQLFASMFETGMTPSQALTFHLANLRQLHGDNFDQVAMDRSICPDIQWCYRQFYKQSRRCREPPSTAAPDQCSLLETAYTESQLNDAVSRLQATVDTWIERLRCNPHLFILAVNKLVSDSNAIANDDMQLADAMSSFGCKLSKTDNDKLTERAGYQPRKRSRLVLGNTDMVPQRSSSCELAAVTQGTGLESFIVPAIDGATGFYFTLPQANTPIDPIATSVAGSGLDLQCLLSRIQSVGASLPTDGNLLMSSLGAIDEQMSKGTVTSHIISCDGMSTFRQVTNQVDNKVTLTPGQLNSVCTHSQMLTPTNNLQSIGDGTSLQPSCSISSVANSLTWQYVGTKSNTGQQLITVGDHFVVKAEDAIAATASSGGHFDSSADCSGPDCLTQLSTEQLLTFC